jgi:hypothetical protein
MVTTELLQIEEILEAQAPEEAMHKYFIWAFKVPENKCLSPFVLTATKRAPLPKKYCWLLFEAMCKPTTDEICIQDRLIPQVGDICGTNEGLRVKIVSIQ